MRRRLVPGVLLLLAACASSGDDAAVSGDEERQLNEAAAMLDANSVGSNVADPDPTNRGIRR